MYLEAAGSIRLEKDKCLNRLYRGVECRTCLEQCPVNALSLEDGRLVFEEENCVNCGLCLSQCPTGVFWLEEWDEQKLVRSALESEAETVVLFCGRHPAPFRKAQKMACFQVPMCLGGLSRAALFEIGAKKKLELMVDGCETCEWRRGQGVVKRQAEQTCEMLCACRGQGELYTVEKRPDGEKGRKRKAVPSGERACSRRDIIFRLMDAGRRTLVSEKAQPAAARPGVAAGPVLNGVRTGRKMTYRPEWMERLKQSYRKAYETTEAHGEPAAWPAIRIRRNCTNCNMCASFCPTGALRIEVEELRDTTEGESGGAAETKEAAQIRLTAAHYFQPMLCADCRLCEAACPIGAIVRDRIPTERPFVTQIICKGPVVPCKKCGALTYNVTSGRCYWCGSEASVDDIKQAVRLKLGKKK